VTAGDTEVTAAEAVRAAIAAARRGGDASRWPGKLPVADRLTPEETEIPGAVQGYAKGTEKLTGEALDKRIETLNDMALATYKIDHKREGAYHLLTFASEPATLTEISRVLKITDGVMRHLAVRRVEGASTRPPQPAPEEPVAAAARTSQDSETRTETESPA